MVFANLTEADKEAFFRLLDEYFSSRPELARALGLDVDATATTMKQAGTRMLDTLGGQLRAGSGAGAGVAPAIAPKVGVGVGAAKTQASLAGNSDVLSAVGRVAAASRAFAGNVPQIGANTGTGTGNAVSSHSDTRPPPPTSRHTASSTSSHHDDPISAIPSGIVSQRKLLGDVDGMLRGMRGKEKEKDAANTPTSAAPATALALVGSAASKGFAPPPVRRVASDSTPSLPKRRTPARAPAPAPEPEPDEEEEEEVPQGEWAQALYDYNSSDPNDLPLRENQRVLVTARTSDDWWTGEVDGKSGLFPATYVKVL